MPAPSRRVSGRSAALLTGPGRALLVAALLAGCSQPRAGDGTAPAPKPGAQQIATAADIQRAPNEPVEKYLMARSAGVVIGRTVEGNLTVRIRGGANSLYGNNAPLYIVDGVPFVPGTDGGLAGLNPYDISSIKVLKDATDITMYGVRGANGVIVIKTKSARQ